MKSPIDTVKGIITDIDERTGTVTIKARYDDWYTLIKRAYKEAYVELVDSRPLSDKQRRMCWALVGEIAEYTGELKSEAMVGRKLDFLAAEIGETAERIFSLSNAPMSLVCAFQAYLVRFIVHNDIPTRFPLLDYVEDTGDYVYACLMSKKCVVCGRKADLHHIDRVGMGRDRDDICHEGLEALPLCREHHQEAHTMPDSAFFGRYHLDGGITLDKTLCRIWKLKARRG